jgi:hypothetical protein
MRAYSCCAAYSDTADPSPALAGEEHIPASLRDALERDPTYKAELLFNPIKNTAYYNNKEEEEEEADAALVLDRVKAVFQGIHMYKQHTMDENAWCLHVVTPLLQLATILYGRGQFRQDSVYVCLFLTSLHSNNIDNRNPSSPPTSPPPASPAPSPPPSSAKPTSACPTHTSTLCMPTSTRPSVTSRKYSINFAATIILFATDPRHFRYRPHQ